MWSELFHQGRLSHLHQHLGAHCSPRGTRFQLWAPRATSVHLIGDFNNWNSESHPLQPTQDRSVWRSFVPQAEPGQHYKYQIKGCDGVVRIKADPMAFGSELRPRDASTIIQSNHQWQDYQWLANRQQRVSAPKSIYEVHLGSWRRNGEHWLSYRELADVLPAYVKELGFTHIEFMPLTEHPLDESWGYQSLGFFCPTARFGSADDLKFLIDRCHELELAVILDWVPVHFPTNASGMSEFDGSQLYETQTNQLSTWGSHEFDITRPEVRSFLLSSAIYWLEEFHFDGLRVDAVTNFIAAEPQRQEANFCFLRQLNEACRTSVPGCLLIAEDSSDHRHVTTRTGDKTSLAFDYKWDMGWMHDTLTFFEANDQHRVGLYNKLTFGMSYHHDEHFIKPLSHDEVVHGKSPMLYKMYGRTRHEQVENLKLLYALQWLLPGHTHLFMGNEFAAEREWSPNESLPWHLTQYPEHQSVTMLIRELNSLCRSSNALGQDDQDWNNFSWIECDAAESGYLAFSRKAPGEYWLVLANLHGRVLEGEIAMDGFWHRTDFTTVLDTSEDFSEPALPTTKCAVASQTYRLAPYSLQLWAPVHISTKGLTNGELATAC